ncbi:MAG: bifunctional (p)ppGpp synthetase/guanosine-3',5'-bis(diphosphate) 3'-pyrophosphohydrolase [Ignavibacteria bacterium]|nr:bifunctional (p)ppGpp synthetase/guanosine-3',5'-bis(diphosphate) 3'-pyrophosphohydrolase [Bacteroidota bacterium]MSQ46077.1 bifunctional (p)ppGpp synthetase/guanosine-3',5'-bis(diphosphate) 3'-pyrophosphohydrolase [Ignavibacteria bacterium]
MSQLDRKLEELLSTCRTHLRSVDEDLIRKAFELSLTAHQHDKRESGEPYFNHPFEVAMIVAREISIDDISVACSLLHDVVEDTKFDLAYIRSNFGNIVADIVDGTTKISDIFRSHEVITVENYRKLLLSIVNDARVIVVKIADRLHNMRTLEFLKIERQQKIAKETLDIYVPFAHRFGLAKIKWEMEDLAFKYLNPVEYDEVAVAVKSKRKTRENYIKRFTDPISEKLHQERIVCEITGRPKHLFSIWNKMKTRSKVIDEIYDLFAVRIILDSEDKNKCYNVYGIVSELYKPIPERFKDYISIPKKNGYQSIHTTVVGLQGKLVEVQIRTKKMDEVAERGIAAHWAYKENIPIIDKDMLSWISWVRDIFGSTDSSDPKELIESFKLNLYQDEIYIFTPKGDLRILPKGSTPIDFAYEVHSEIGSHTIGAKISGRMVPLSTILKSGDQVEIITSKKQTPNADWDKFVVTHKAKSQIRRWIKEKQRDHIEAGEQLWQRRIKKVKISISNDDLIKFISHHKIESLSEFYEMIGKDEQSIDQFINLLQLHIKPIAEQSKGAKQEASLFSKFIQTARKLATDINILGSTYSFKHSFAKCCNPIPGDEIIGFITTGEGLKIHRINCRNILLLQSQKDERVIEVGWPKTSESEFLCGIRLVGKDRMGILQDISKTISEYQNTNIRSVNMTSKDKMMDGYFIIFVKDLPHLNSIIDRVKRVRGINIVERFEYNAT